MVRLPQVEQTDVTNELSALATLADLPSELLLLIMQDLDNEDLLNLGLTCQRMNFIALNHFFFINNIRDPRGGSFSSQRNPLPVETFAVLRSALFVKDLKYFYFMLNSGVERMHSEFSDIHALAARLQTMEKFSMSFHRIDPSFITSILRNSLPMDPWYRSVTGLLNAVLEKGCTELRVTGGDHFSELYIDQPPLQGPLGSNQSEVNVNRNPSSVKEEGSLIRYRLLSYKSFPFIQFFWRKRKAKAPQGVGNNKKNPASDIASARENSGKLHQSPNTAVDLARSPTVPQTRLVLPSSRKLCLTHVCIHYDMLLHYPFSQWTLSTLNTASSTITKLSLKLTAKVSSTWKIFSATLSLPLLRDFSFNNDFFRPADVAAFVDIEDFLLNHPQINHLCIYGVDLPSPKAAPRPSFQNLTTFDAHPLYIVWLMNSLVSSPNALPSLERVVISSKGYRYSPREPDFDYSLFDSALAAVATFPRNIVVALTFNSRPHIADWFHGHIRAGVKRSVISRLMQVETLSIYDNWSEYPQPMIAIIPDWLQLFPALRHLKFENEAQKNVAKLIEPQYVATVATLCQNLETMDVNWETFDLQLVRRKLSDGVGSDGL